MAERVSVIVNPAAGRGRGARMIPQIRERFAEVGVSDILFTRQRGDEGPLAEQAIAQGCTTLVVVGGDGTTTHVGNAILKSGSNTRLAVLPAGTGNDFAKTLGTDRSDVATLARLSVQAGDARIDVGKIEDRFFLNCCGFGFDVAVLEGIERTRWLRGNAVYLYTALRQLFDYDGIDLQIGGTTGGWKRHLLLVIANTEYFGGMFRIAPGASAADGMLDAVSILDVPHLRRIPLLAAATRGAHASRPECTITRAMSFKVSFPVPPTYETDGELHRAQAENLVVTSCPRALRVVTASGVALQ
ncbi:MAG TPA: YegS/Rv2252/BmrU family lipid kinase [Gemmatimonadaceae bacterium]|nr:YegS/Rv2252/BmrU family lipid kinase [Gemmatimonadaceae bacterium]